MRSLLLFIVILSGCAQDIVLTGSYDDSLFPLHRGSEWQYERSFFYRGNEIGKDTLTVSVTQQDGSAYTLVMNSSLAIDTIKIEKVDDETYINQFSRDTLLSFRYGMPQSLLLTTGYHPSERKEYFVDETDSAGTRRIIQKMEFIDTDGITYLRMQFEHIFQRGVGQVAARFISDLNECLRCSVPVEFWTYELIGRK